MQKAVYFCGWNGDEGSFVVAAPASSLILGFLCLRSISGEDVTSVGAFSKLLLLWGALGGLVARKTLTDGSYFL